MGCVKLKQDIDTYYLSQDLRGMTLYQRTKAINQFIKHETKILENCIETHLRAIFSRNGINVYESDKSVLNGLFGALKSKGIDIEIVDIYKNAKYDNAVVVGVSENYMTVILEDDYMLSCGIRVKEIKENGTTY